MIVEFHQSGVTVNLADIGYDTRIESSDPKAYRLARRATGELVLQGRFEWTSMVTCGSDWRDMPTADLP